MSNPTDTRAKPLKRSYHSWTWLETGERLCSICGLREVPKSNWQPSRPCRRLGSLSEGMTQAPHDELQEAP